MVLSITFLNYRDAKDIAASCFKQMKLCKDCHWHKSHDYYKNGTSYYDECLCPDIPKYKNPITGEEIINRCLTARFDEKTCGKDGKYWTERKPPETKEQFWSRMFNFG